MTDRPPIQLDWVAYFQAFDQTHGGCPVKYGGRFLWQDGWTYSSTDHAGPEWEPPKDPKALLQLQRAYWRKRLSQLNKERDEVLQQVNYLEGLQSVKSAPLQVASRAYDAETNSHYRTAIEIDLPALRQEVQLVTQDIDVCNEKLEEIKCQMALYTISVDGVAQT